jgi:hypothetical protein
MDALTMHTSLVVSILAMGVALTSALPDVTPLTCLERDLTPSSGSSDASSGSSNGYIMSFVACLPNVTLQTIPSLPDTAAQHPPPTWNESIACAATCGSLEHLLRLESGGVQFAIYNGSCYCVNQTAAIPPSTNQTCYDVAIFQVSFLCAYLNVSLGCGPGCSNVDGCCAPNTTPDPNDLPSYYRTMIQWVAIVVIVLALVEAIVYGCLRRRAMAQRQRRMRTSVRPKRDAKEITERLLGSLPSSPNAAQEPSIMEESCSICLEPLTSEPSLMLPCRHNIHRSCLRDFITHQLVRSNEVTCPMCRAVIVEEDESSPHDRDGSPPVRIASAPE